MGGAQVSDSVARLQAMLGFQAISLTNMDTSASTVIAAGSKVEIASAFFSFPTSGMPQASTWTAIATANTAYITLTPSGVAGSQVLTAKWSDTVPVWSISKQGWYASTDSAVRYIGGCGKGGAASYQNKFFLPGFMADSSVFHIRNVTDRDTRIKFASDANFRWDESSNEFIADKRVWSPPSNLHSNVSISFGSVYSFFSAAVPATNDKRPATGTIFYATFNYDVSMIKRNRGASVQFYSIKSDGTAQTLQMGSGDSTSVQSISLSIW